MEEYIDAETLGRINKYDIFQLTKRVEKLEMICGGLVFLILLLNIVNLFLICHNF